MIRVNSYIAVKFCMLFWFSADFFLSNKFFIFNISFKKYRKSVKQLGSRSGPKYFGPDLGPNCLQMLSGDNTRQVNCKVQ